MVDLGLLWPPMLVAEALWTGKISAELAAILVAYPETGHEDRAVLSLEKRSSRGIHSFPAHLASEADFVPGLEWVTVV